MVGVAGRSKGCKTCKARKKGCDQRRPTCGQCQKSNLVCGGYNNSMTFVPFKPHQSIPSIPLPAKDDYYNTSVAIIPRQSSSLNQAAFESRVLDGFWEIYFPKGSFAQQVPRADDFLSWVYSVQQDYAREGLVKTTMLAIGLASLGRRSGEQRFNVAAMEAYAQALMEVNRSLQDAAKWKQNSLLATCKLLALYEASGGSGGHSVAYNWEKHQMGVLRLLQMRGPDSCVDGAGHDLFLDARYNLMITSITQRKICILSSAEWRNIPFTTRHKDLRQHLIDIMLQLPNILAAFDKVKNLTASPKSLDDARWRLFQLCRTLDEAIQQWLGRLRAQTSPSILEAVANGIPETFHLRDVVFAHTMNLYWTLCLLFYGTVKLAFQVFGVSETSFGQCFQGDKFDAHPHACNVARSAMFFFRPDAGTISAQMFSFPMGMALTYMAYSHSEKSPEFVQLVQGFQQGQTGDMIRKFLVSLQATSTSKQKVIEFKLEPRDEYPVIRARSLAWFARQDVPELDDSAYDIISPRSFYGPSVSDNSYSSNNSSQG